jgi:hypothetical protein
VPPPSDADVLDARMERLEGRGGEAHELVDDD